MCMPPKLESPLAKLEEKVKQRATVTKPEIKQVIIDELAAVDKLYPNPSQAFDRKAHREEVEKFGQKLMIEQAHLYEAWDKGRLDFFERSRNELWPKGNEDLEKIHNRPKKLAETYQKSRDLTDPDNGGIGEDRIYNYQGFDILGGTRISGSTNAHNVTRNALSGYLTAMGMDSDDRAQNEYTKAHKIFVDKWINQLNVDDLKETMGMGKYVTEIRAQFPGEKFSNETIGYLSGLLKMADEDYPQTYDAYREYLFDNLKRLDAAGSLDIPAYTKTNNFEKDAENGAFQINAMASIQTSKEWVEIFTGMRKAFEKLRTDAGSLTDRLGFEYRDITIKKFLERDPATIILKDRVELEEVSGLVANEAYGKVLDKKTETDKVLKEIKAKVDAYQGDNSAEIQKEMNDLLDEFTVIEIKPGMSPSELVTMLDSLDAVTSKARVLDSRIVGHEKKEEDEKEKKEEEAQEESEFMKEWKNPNWVDPMFAVDRVQVAKRSDQLHYRNDDGTDGGTVPEGTILKIIAPPDNTKEVQGIRYVKVEFGDKKVWVDQSYLELLKEEVNDTLEFIEDKHLKEITEDGSKFKYELGAPKIMNENGQILILTENKDIDKRIAWRMNDYLRIITEAEGADFKKQVASVNFKTIDDVRNFLDGYFTASGKQNDAADVRRFFGAVNDAYEHSVLQYETKPSLGTLGGDYEEKVIPAWDQAVAEAMKLKKRPTTSESKDKGLTKDKEDLKKARRDEITAEAMRLLDSQNYDIKYARALNKLAAFEMNAGKRPQGVTLSLPFNGAETPVNVRYENGGTTGRVIVEYQENPRKVYYFDSMKRVAINLNGGNLNRIRTRDFMNDKSSYAGTEALVGKLDFVDKVTSKSDKPYQLHLEFDWEGAFDDPDIYVRALPHGRIEYKMQWDDANFDGENWRSGVVEDFDSFIQVMGHVREWGNRYDKISEDRKQDEQLREYNYNVLSDSMHLARHESRIGRMVKYETGVDYKSVAFLDWGGGNNPYSKQNARLSVWVGVDGMFNYKVERRGLPTVSASGSASSLDQVAVAVGCIKARAGF